MILVVHKLFTVIGYSRYAKYNTLCKSLITQEGNTTEKLNEIELQNENGRNVLFAHIAFQSFISLVNNQRYIYQNLTIGLSIRNFTIIYLFILLLRIVVI